MFVSIITTISLFAIIISNIEAVGENGRFETEEERVANWYAKGNQWPPKWRPESEAFKKNMEKREKEIMSIPAADERWENWVQFTSSRMVPSFTPTGFKVIKIPPAIYAKMKSALDEGLRDWNELPVEEHMDPVTTPLPSKFIDLGDLEWQVLDELKGVHEEWAGVELEPTSAYGARLYQNGSALAMHYDKIETHVISSVVHIDHQYDDESNPWSIEIENHDGEIYSVNLEPGEMLLHESASCLHGNMKPFRGKYYASLFLHYKPRDAAVWNFSQEDVIENVPPFWSDGIVDIYSSRYQGAAVTVDELSVLDLPPREVRSNLRGSYRMPEAVTPQQHIITQSVTTSNLRGTSMKASDKQTEEINNNISTSASGANPTSDNILYVQENESNANNQQLRRQKSMESNIEEINGKVMKVVNDVVVAGKTMLRAM
eukprot:gene7834-10640_t